MKNFDFKLEGVIKLLWEVEGIWGVGGKGEWEGKRVLGLGIKKNRK